ncbi:MAG: electron transfer flavoprotein subunit beta/FixA family protein [candidate division WOR-3 bacterium]
MKIAVCVRRVPDTSEAALRVDQTGKHIIEDNLIFTINEADNYALEEALLLKDRTGADVTLLTLGTPESVEVLRMGLAKGAGQATRIDDAGIDDADSLVIARILAAFLQRGNFDLVLTGCIAQDVEDSQVGPALAQMLGWPHAAYVTKLDVGDKKLLVRRELEGGLLETEELTMPCVVSIQTGGNTPRYASILGIKRAKTKPVVETRIEELGIGDSETKPMTTLLKLYVPEVVSGAEMIEGDVPTKARRVAEILRERGLA